MWDEIICLVSVLLFCGLLRFWFSLPNFAVEHYVNPGNAAYGDPNVPAQRQFIIAENQYNRALKLDPKNQEVYYKLGNLYRELQDFDKAIDNYKIAFKGGITKAADDIASSYLEEKEYTKADKWLRQALALQIRSANGQLYTINQEQYIILQTLVRVYLDNADYANAFRWISLGQGGTKGDPEKQYTLTTYLGWTLLNQERYREAKDHLQNAILLKDQRQQALAHCLLAQVLEKSKEEQGVDAEWEKCIAYGNQNNPDEYNWMALAHKYFQTKGQQR